MRLSLYLSVIGALSLTPLPLMAASPEKTEKPAPTSITLGSDGLPAVWLQGTPVKNWEPGKIYLLEFWATWCGPCLAQIPHLNELHKELPDSDKFQIVGINVFDKVPPKALQKFLADRTPSPTYTIGADTESKSASLWLKPLGVSGIPFSAIVKDGNILWKGHPGQLNKELIQNIIDGKPIAKPRDVAAEQQALISTLQKISDLYIVGKYQEGGQAVSEALKQPELSTDQQLRILKAPFPALLHTKQYDQLRTTLDRIPKDLPNDHYALMSYAHTIITSYEIPVDKKNLKGAEDALLKVIELRKADAKKKYSSSYEWGRIAEARMLSGDHKGAIEAQEEAVRQLPLYQFRNNLTK